MFFWIASLICEGEEVIQGSEQTPEEEKSWCETCKNKKIGGLVGSVDARWPMVALDRAHHPGPIIKHIELYDQARGQLPGHP